MMCGSVLKTATAPADRSSPRNVEYGSQPVKTALVEAVRLKRAGTRFVSPVSNTSTSGISRAAASTASTGSLPSRLPATTTRGFSAGARAEASDARGTSSGSSRADEPQDLTSASSSFVWASATVARRAKNLSKASDHLHFQEWKAPVWQSMTRARLRVRHHSHATSGAVTGGVATRTVAGIRSSSSRHVRIAWTKYRSGSRSLGRGPLRKYQARPPRARASASVRAWC